MNWNSFWSSLIGTTIPALAVSIFMLYLTHRTNQALEHYRKGIEQDLSDHQLWHEKRVAALLAIYDEFVKYLDFLRRELYVKPSKGFDVTPQHNFFNAIQINLVYFNDELRQKILKYQEEILDFWNWTAELRASKNTEDWKEVQRRLDYEMPRYLEKLRKDINEYSDPVYREMRKRIREKHK